MSINIRSTAHEDLDSATQSGLRRARSWRVPPNWSRSDWFEELTAVGTAAAWQAFCEFDPERGIALAAFGYCRIISRCLARYRKEWRYALHLAPSVSHENETATFKSFDSTAASARAEEPRCSNDHLRGAVGALPPEQRRLIEQLFWEKRTETEVANTMRMHQSTISRRKRTILKVLRMKLCDGNELKRILQRASASRQSSELRDSLSQSNARNLTDLA